MCLETIAEKLIDVFCCFYIGSLQCCRDCFCGSLSGCKHVRGSIGVQQWARARRKHHACAEKFRKHMIGENTIFRIVPTRIPPGTGFSKWRCVACKNSFALNMFSKWLSRRADKANADGTTRCNACTDEAERSRKKVAAEALAHVQKRR